MLGIPRKSEKQLIKEQYLPTDKVGGLYCWSCWDILKTEKPKLHNAGQKEKCDRCKKQLIQK